MLSSQTGGGTGSSKGWARKIVNLWANIVAKLKGLRYCYDTKRSHLFWRFQIYLTLFCSFYGSRVINVFAKSLKIKIHLQVERGKSSNFERTLWQNYRAYNSCTNINWSHLFRRFQICLILFCSFYGFRVINVFAKTLETKIHDIS